MFLWSKASPIIKLLFFLKSSFEHLMILFIPLTPTILASTLRQFSVSKLWRYHTNAIFSICRSSLITFMTASMNLTLRLLWCSSTALPLVRALKSTTRARILTTFVTTALVTPWNIYDLPPIRGVLRNLIATVHMHFFPFLLSLQLSQPLKKYYKFI